jgi:uroporphyrin-III C-methyltransferase
MNLRVSRDPADAVNQPSTESDATPGATSGAPAPAPAPIPAAAASLPASGLAVRTPTWGPLPAWAAALLLLSLVLAASGLWQAWNTREALRGLELELVKRQQDSGQSAQEALLLARQSQDISRDAAAKLALVEQRVAEVALQRSQLEDLIQSLSRSRDENAVADIDASIRVALQQTAITGSAEPLVAALRNADERLARINQPRLERLRRALARDLDRVRAVGVPDIGQLLIKLDEAVRLVDELPLIAQSASTVRQRGTAPLPVAAAASGAPGAPALRPEAPALLDGWAARFYAWSRPLNHVWTEVRGLLRVTRIGEPEAMLIAPEQGYFLRENLKLRLLNARLSLLSRQLEPAAADLRSAQASLTRYFDADSRRTQLVDELLRQVAAQSRQTVLPRPDETLAAIAASLAGR